MHNMKCLTLKMKFKVTDYTNRNDPVTWQISTSIKVLLEHFSQALTVFKIFTFQISWPGKCRSKSWCKKFATASYDGKYLTSWRMTIVIVAFFQPIPNKKFDFENIGNGHCRHSIANIRFDKSHTWTYFASSHCFPDIKYVLFPEI